MAHPDFLVWMLFFPVFVVLLVVFLLRSDVLPRPVSNFWKGFTIYHVAAVYVFVAWKLF